MKKYRTIALLIIASLLFVYFVGEPWWYVNFGTGKDGGDALFISSDDVIYDRSGNEFKKVVQKDNVALTDLHIKQVGLECGKVDLKRSITVSNHSLKFSFEASTCNNNEISSVLDKSYREIGKTRGNLIYTPPGENYKYKLNDDMPIEPVGIDCIAYADNFGDKIVKTIDFAIRVKNTDKVGVAKQLECELKNLPSGEYSVSLGNKNGITITIP
jgi:hypothetical protein